MFDERVPVFDLKAPVFAWNAPMIGWKAQVFDRKAPVLDWNVPVLDREVVRRVRTVMLRAGQGGLAGAARGHEPSRAALRAAHGRATRLRVKNRGGPRDGALTEGRSRIQPAEDAPVQAS